MTDGELLARAAQVAQLPGELPPPDQEYGWNPLLYNCDAFDLLVQLGLRVQFLEVGVIGYPNLRIFGEQGGTVPMRPVKKGSRVRLV